MLVVVVEVMEVVVVGPTVVVVVLVVEVVERVVIGLMVVVVVEVVGVVVVVTGRGTEGETVKAT